MLAPIRVDSLPILSALSIDDLANAPKPATDKTPVIPVSDVSAEPNPDACRLMLLSDLVARLSNELKCFAAFSVSEFNLAVSKPRLTINDPTTLFAIFNT